MNNLVFTGPESSGKTTLAKQITELKKGVFVQEFAREYLNKLNRNYSQKDLLEIAKGQFELQEIAKKNNQKKLFFDTDLLTIKIWSEYKYGDCDKWILDRILSNKEFVYVLCSPTIVWELDPLRENPKDRDKLYKIYLENLRKFNLNFIEVRGGFSERVNLFLNRN
jgi:nicotinamide riboside kinase